MAFRLGDILIDHIQYGVAENSKGLLYVLTQLSEATINTTAESVDVNDARGSLMKRFYRGKNAELTATNAILNANIIAAASGNDIQDATAAAPIVMPKIITVKAGSKATLEGFVDGTVTVSGLDASGANLGEAFQRAETASATAFALTTEGAFTPPTAAGVEMYLVKYMRNVESGFAIRNSADKIPASVTLTLKVLAYDPCHTDELRVGYVEFPSFQVSPEIEISLSSEGTLNYTGQAQVNYCSADKELYSFYWAEDDVDVETKA